MPSAPLNEFSLPTTESTGVMTMTDNQIKWAGTHDWYVRRIGQAVIVHERQTKDRILYERLRRFDSFPSLYRWAGY